MAKRKEKKKPKKFPDPRPWDKLLFQEVERHRNLDCEDYPKCLDYASQRLWEGFTCRYCPFFHRRDGRNDRENKMLLKKIREILEKGGLV